MELFEQIRREYEYGGGTIRGIAKKLGIHRRMVREAVLSAIPVERKTPVRERPKLAPAMAFVDALLEADCKAPRKQRHTAHRICCRIRAEMPEVKAAESTIRRHVRERKIKLGLTRRETFIPQSYSRGAEAQVDWYEAYAEICGERQKTYRNNSGSLRPSIRSLLLPSFNSEFRRGLHTTRLLTCGFSRLYNQAAQVPSSKVTCKLPHSPSTN